jgi:hypothetical protein
MEAIPNRGGGLDSSVVPSWRKQTRATLGSSKRVFEPGRRDPLSVQGERW